MNIDKLFYKWMSLPFALSSMDGDYLDSYIFCNEKLMKASVNLIIEIDELLEEGKTKEEIKTLITECDFTTSIPDITGDEVEQFRYYALKALNIRYRIYEEKKEEEQGVQKKISEKHDFL